MIRKHTEVQRFHFQTNTFVNIDVERQSEPLWSQPVDAHTARRDPEHFTMALSDHLRLPLYFIVSPTLILERPSIVEGTSNTTFYWRSHV